MSKIWENLYIQSLAFGGEGVAKISTEKGDLVVFVEGGLPGQTVSARIIKQKKSYAQGKLFRIEQRAAEEQTDLPYQPIAGAPMLRLPIALQEQYKAKATLEMFARLGPKGLDWEALYEGYVSSPSAWHYRNKMEYSFSTLVSALETAEESEGFALGFKRKGQWWAVENLDKDSGLFDAALENALPKIRAFCEATGLPAWNPRLSEGFFRYLVVRKSFSDNQLLINLVTTDQGLEQFDLGAWLGLLQEILGPRLAGALHTTNNSTGDSAKQPSAQERLLFGQDFIRERILGLPFEIRMQSFFQTNPLCAERLYTRAIEYVERALADGAGGQVAMDLFCGTGTIAQLLAKSPKIERVIGVDIVPEAIADAKQSAQANGLSGLEFHAADVKDFLKLQPQYRGQIGVIVLDPPRSGIVPKALLRVIELGAKDIVYISCNPSTQARDAEVLAEHGYILQKLSLVDQFPHTTHIESVAWLRKA